MAHLLIGYTGPRGGYSRHLGSAARIIAATNKEAVTVTAWKDKQNASPTFEIEHWKNAGDGLFIPKHDYTTQVYFLFWDMQTHEIKRRTAGALLQIKSKEPLVFPLIGEISCWKHVVHKESEALHKCTTGTQRIQVQDYHVGINLHIVNNRIVVERKRIDANRCTLTYLP